MKKDVRKIVAEQVILHTAFVLDGSGSMEHLKNSVVKVVDNQIANLAEQSKRLNQETRGTFYWFDDEVYCAYYDKDVLRMPSIADFYDIDGTTALVSATMKAITDLEKSATLYGQHDFLIFVVTDGFENASDNRDIIAFPQKMKALPLGWQVAVLVPNERSRDYAIRFGFPADNIMIWDARSAAGLERAAVQINTAISNYATARSKGIRPTGSLFTIDTKAVNQAVVGGQIKPFDPANYFIFDVAQKSDAATFSGYYTNSYIKGRVFYQLTNRKPEGEDVQGNKKILLRHNKTGIVFGPNGTRGVLGLPDDGQTHRVKADMNPEYSVFVQSTAPNRALWPGDKVIITKHDL